MSQTSKRIGETAGFSMRKIGKVLGSLLGNKPEPAEQVFIETMFLLFGHLAQADGRISQQEAELGEKLIRQLELNRHGRRMAVDHFERGKRGDFVLERVLRQFNAAHTPHSARSRELMDVLIELAKADGRLRPAERGLLEKIATGLGVAPRDLQRRLELGEPLPAPSTHSGLDHAYALLGIASAASNDDLRQAYRRLLSKLHPDKLSGQGHSGAALQDAQERTQQVRAAYELVCAARGIR